MLLNQNSDYYVYLSLKGSISINSCETSIYHLYVLNHGNMALRLTTARYSKINLRLTLSRKKIIVWKRKYYVVYGKLTRMSVTDM